MDISVTAGASTAGNSALPAALTKKRAQDMSPGDWRGLLRGLIKFLFEESEDAEHKADGAKDCANDEAPLACDEFGSVRTTDKDGHLHITRTPITRAVVSDYYGREINGWQRFGLDPERKYGLYRDLEELKKGADSFIGKPVLLRHKASTANDHPRDLTVGSIGGPMEFDGDTLYAPLTIWDAEAIHGIETGERRGLSCGYRYEADMTPGTAPDGTRYDGRMLAIGGNHLAIISEPRVQGAMVADSITGFDEASKEIGHAGSNSSIGDNQETQNMTTAAPARLVNALSAFIKPRLAPNQTLEGIEAILALDEEAKEMKDKRARDEEEERKEKEAEDKKAKDEAEAEAKKKEAEDKKAHDAKRASDRKARDEKRAADRKARDSDPDGLHEWLKKKLGAEDFKAACDMLESERKAEDEDDEDEEAGMEDARAKDSKPAFDEAAIDRKIQTARAEERRNQTAIYDARNFVRPYVGELSAMAFDSAEDVYAAALKGLNISTEGVHPSAYRKILEVTPKPGQRTQATTSMALDSSARAAAEAIAPGLKRIKVGV